MTVDWTHTHVTHSDDVVSMNATLSRSLFVCLSQRCVLDGVAATADNACCSGARDENGKCYYPAVSRGAINKL